MCAQPVPEELQNGPGFGYVVAFRPHGATGWMQAAVPSPEASRYVFKNESIQPFSPFHVKVGVYNNVGEGPFGPVSTIYSAEDGRSGWREGGGGSRGGSSGAGGGLNGLIVLVRGGGGTIHILIDIVFLIKCVSQMNDDLVTGYNLKRFYAVNIIVHQKSVEI